MEVILNGKTVRNVTVMKNVDSKNVPYTILTKRGHTYSLMVSERYPEMLGVVKRGSFTNHKFRGYDWLKKEGNNLIGVS